MTKVITWLVAVLALPAVAGLWLFSHFSPEKFGSCRQVPLNLGEQAYIEECQAYPTTDFIVPLAVAIVGVLLVSSADIEFTIPGFGTIKRARAKEAAKSAEGLKETTETLDERGKKFLKDLPTATPPPKKKKR